MSDFNQWFESATPHHQRRPLQRGRWHRQKDKNRSPLAKNQSSGVFRRETASGFYPWCKVEGPRKRVAEGLCGWRHGNSFPMTQSAQSHRQMRSIPRCSKAVFYVFVFFDSIHDSATKHTLSPEIFHRTEIMPKGGSEITRVCIT